MTKPGTDSKRKRPRANYAMWLFAVPFCAIGLIAAYLALAAIIRSDFKQAGFAGIFALTFGGVGFGVLVAILKAPRALAAREALRRRYPGEPWKWRKDWASGRVEGSGRRTMIAAWCLGLVWNLITIPGLLGAIEEYRRAPHPKLLIVLIFPFAGAFLLFWAIRATLRYRRFGTSVFEMATVPGVIGRGLRGRIRVRLPRAGDTAVRLTLVSIHRTVTGRGKHRSVRERVLWQEEHEVPGFALESGGRTTWIPVAFAIPGDLKQTDDDDPRDGILWRMIADAGLPGVDYHARFEVPVFVTSDSDRASMDEFEPQREPYRQPAESPIRVSSNGDETQIVFPAARNLGPTLSLLFFAAIWTGATWLMWRLGAPLPFPVLFGLFDVVLVGILAQLLFLSKRVTVTSRDVVVESDLLLVRWTRFAEVDEIDGVNLKIGIQNNARPYYDIRIRRRDGRKLCAGGSIRDKREGEWLVGIIRDRLGLADGRGTGKAGSDAVSRQRLRSRA